MGGNADGDGDSAAATPPPPRWRRAAVETTILLSTTGGEVWGAAEAAVAFFEQHWTKLCPPLALATRPLRVLELGAGCGMVGLTLALNAAAGASAPKAPPRCSVLLTEQPDGLAHLERNVRLNAKAVAAGGGGNGGLDARAVACDWGDFVGAGAASANEDDDDDTGNDDENDDAENALWRSCERVAPGSLPRADVIIGSDLIYLSEGARALPRTIAALLRRGRTRRRGGGGGGGGASGGGCGCGGVGDDGSSAAYYSHTRHRFDALDVELEEQCAACGLEMVELDPATGSPFADSDDGGSGGSGGDRGRRPRSPPPFTELYPEQRVAVYRLRLVG